MQKQFKKVIHLFWWSEPRLMGKNYENYGDLLSKYLVEKISGKEVKWIQPKKIPWYKFNRSNLLAVGSIIHHANKRSVVWGSGIIDHKQNIAKAEFRAVRGPLTRKYLVKLGYACPEIYGDPALLLPIIFYPEIKKKYSYGIVPHYHDYKVVVEQYKNKPKIKVIDLMTLDVENVTTQILECEKIISSSLHGLIVSHAYGIPALLVQFSNKLFGDGVKFRDYLESVNLEFKEINFWVKAKNLEEIKDEFNNNSVLPSKVVINSLQKGLMNSCPILN
jgi:pyruvyltransferase